jgi:hypothetical protein
MESGGESLPSVVFKKNQKEEEGTGWLLGLGEHCNRRQRQRQLLLFFEDLLFLRRKNTI